MGENYFQPIAIKNDLLVYSSFHHVEGSYQYRIMIDPNVLWNRASPNDPLDARRVVDIRSGGKTVLDMGCGTAVLAILASMKGARAVTHRY